MKNFRHPSSLNAFQRYGQAKSVVSATSRANQDAWYKDALEQALQLHVRIDAASISAHYYDSSTQRWNSGPHLTEQILEDPAARELFITDVLAHLSKIGAKSLGVVLHLADEFATMELKPELENPATISELRDAAVNDPASILEDSSINPSQASWRVIPYSASGGQAIGTCISVSRQHSGLLDTFRAAGVKANFPIITLALSAPLVAITNLCHVLDRPSGTPFIAILQYASFTVLAFFNEQSDLRLIRTLQHRGMRRATNIRNALTATSASLEFQNPDIYVIPLGETVDTALHENLRDANLSDNIELTQPSGLSEFPTWCLEPSISVALSSAPTPRLTSHTFAILSNEKWALQDFLPPAPEDLEIFPRRSEMKLMKFFRLARVALFLATTMYLGWLSLDGVKILQSQEWWFDTSQTADTNTKLKNLNTELQRTEHWNNLLEDRAEAWVAMEDLSRMFQENSGLLIISYKHVVTADKAAAAQKAPTNKKSTGGEKATSKGAGIVKEWQISGYASAEGYDFLNSINTREGIAAHFTEITNSTGNTAYDPNLGSRHITVNIPIRENSSYKPSARIDSAVNNTSTYPYIFDMTITQHFDPTDPMAIRMSKAP